MWANGECSATISLQLVIGERQPVAGFTLSLLDSAHEKELTIEPRGPLRAALLYLAIHTNQHLPHCVCQFSIRNVRKESILRGRRQRASKSIWHVFSCPLESGRGASGRVHDRRVGTWDALRQNMLRDASGVNPTVVDLSRLRSVPEVACDGSHAMVNRHAWCAALSQQRWASTRLRGAFHARVSALSSALRRRFQKPSRPGHPTRDDPNIARTTPPSGFAPRERGWTKPTTTSY